MSFREVGKTHKIKFQNLSLYVTENYFGSFYVKDSNGDNYACTELVRCLIEAYLTRCQEVQKERGLRLIDAINLQAIADERDSYKELYETECKDEDEKLPN